MIKILRESGGVRQEDAPCEGATVIREYTDARLAGDDVIREWEIAIDSLDDLVKLSKSVGNPVIVWGICGDHGVHLSIYDDWIE
jgi:hypothetical protein